MCTYLSLTLCVSLPQVLVTPAVTTWSTEPSCRRCLPQRLVRHERTHTHTHTRTHTLTLGRTRSWTLTKTLTNTRACALTQTERTRTHTHAHAHIHTYAHAHTHIHTRTRFFCSNKWLRWAAQRLLSGAAGGLGGGTGGGTPSERSAGRGGPLYNVPSCCVCSNVIRVF